MSMQETTKTSALDFARFETRHISPYSTQEKLGRIAWWLIQATLFRWSWHNMYGWRRWLLRLFGAQIAQSVKVRPTVRIECPWNLTMGENSSLGDRADVYALGPISIGQRVTISQYGYLCAASHDYLLPGLPLQRIPIVIEDDAWIAAGAYVGPGVTIREGAILAARGCAGKDLQPWTIYGGNPATEIKPRPMLPEE